MYIFNVELRKNNIKGGGGVSNVAFVYRKVQNMIDINENDQW